jgi:hypothetical protein
VCMDIAEEALNPHSGGSRGKFRAAAVEKSPRI